MKQEKEKPSVIKITHWKSKFEKSVVVLLEGGIFPEQLIEQINTLANIKKQNP